MNKEIIYPKLYKIWLWYSENPHKIPVRDTGGTSLLGTSGMRYSISPKGGHVEDIYIENISESKLPIRGYYIGYGCGNKSLRCEITREEYKELEVLWNKMKEWEREEQEKMADKFKIQAMLEIDKFLEDNSINR